MDWSVVRLWLYYGLSVTVSYVIIFLAVVKLTSKFFVTSLEKPNISEQQKNTRRLIAIVYGAILILGAGILGYLPTAGPAGIFGMNMAIFGYFMAVTLMIG